MAALTPDERNAVVDWIVKDLVWQKALDLFESPESRRRLVDYAEIANELGFDDEARDAYPVERSLSALRRVLADWRDIAEDWLQAHADRQEGSH